MAASARPRIGVEILAMAMEALVEVSNRLYLEMSCIEDRGDERLGSRENRWGLSHVVGPEGPLAFSG